MQIFVELRPGKEALLSSEINQPKLYHQFNNNNKKLNKTIKFCIQFIQLYYNS